jgi:hypothetical protein
VSGVLPLKVEITDIYGRTINVTEKEKINEIKWNNKNIRSGIYFVRAMYGEIQLSKRILVVE